MPRRLLNLGVAALAIVVVGCGGSGSTNTGDPVAAVRSMVSLIEAKQFDQLQNVVCADKQDEVANAFNPGAALASGLPGVDPGSILQAMSVKFNNLQATEQSRNGNTATVNVKSDLVMSVDQAKMRDVMRQILSAQGQTVPDQQLDAMIAAFSSSGNQSIDESVEVVNEGGKWLVCDDISGSF